jgi:hypothetical protein
MRTPAQSFLDESARQSAHKEEDKKSRESRFMLGRLEVSIKGMAWKGVLALMSEPACQIGTMRDSPTESQTADLCWW